MAVGNLGKLIIFEVNANKILTFRDMKRTVSGRWGTHSRLGKKDQSEFLGPELQRVTMTIVLNAQHGVAPRATLDKIEQAIEQGKVHPFVVGGKRVGSGEWKIVSMTDTWDAIYNGGELVKATAEITIEEYL